MPANLEAVYQKMMAKRPADRPGSMSELIPLLESCKDGASAQTMVGGAPKSKTELMVFDGTPIGRAAPQETIREVSIFAEAAGRRAFATNSDLSLEDLAVDVRSDPQPQQSQPQPATPSQAATPWAELITGRSQTLKPLDSSARFRRMRRKIGVVPAMVSIAVLAVGLIWFKAVRQNPRGTERATDPGPVADRSPDETDHSSATENAPAATTSGTKTAALARASAEPDIIADKAPRVLTTALAPDLGPYVERAQFIGHSHPWTEWVRVSPDGKQLLTSGYDRTARLWDIASGRELRRLWHPTALRETAFHPTAGER